MTINYHDIVDEKIESGKENKKRYFLESPSGLKFWSDNLISNCKIIEQSKENKKCHNIK